MLKEPLTKKIEEYLLYILVLTMPIFVWSSFVNPYTTPKLGLLVLGLSILLSTKALRMIASGIISFQTGTFDIPVVLLAVAYLASALLQSPNRMEAFLLPGGATAIIAGGVLYFVVSQTNEKVRHTLKQLMLVSGVFVAINVLLSSTGALNSFSFIPSFIKSSTFNTLGGAIPAFIFLASVLPLGIGFLLHERDVARKVFLGVASSVVALSMLIAVLNIFPGNKASQIPSMNVSWSVATEALKTSPLFGAGPGNYLTAFNKFRPISYNQTDQWATRYTSANSFLLTATTEAGLAALAAIIILAIAIVKEAKTRSKDNERTGFISLITIGVLFAVLPATPGVLLMLFVYLGLNTKNKNVKLGMFAGSHEHSQEIGTKLPVLFVSVPVIAGAAVLSYFTIRALGAEMTYKSAINAIAQNDGRTAYNALRGAISGNPYVDRYHVSYAQVNLALANSMAQKKELTDEERNTIAQLIQQAIREGKVAVTLNPQRAGSWEVLASIYRAIIPLAKGADAYAVQTYSQSVLLDPLNPNTRIALGGIYYAAKAYDDAIDIFKLAVRTKPDHANAHYNLGVAYREKGDVDRAITEMQAVLSLVQNGSDDYKLAQKTLEDLQNKKKAGEATDSTNLTTPTQTEPADTQIELPEDAAPPTPEPSAIPEQTVTSEPSSTPGLTP